MRQKVPAAKTGLKNDANQEKARKSKAIKIELKKNTDCNIFTVV